MSERGAPRYPRSDHRPEFVPRALLQWSLAQGIGTALIDTGKPRQNSTTESFNGKLLDECLSLEWFRNRIEDWRQRYNEVHPHCSLGYLTPMQVAQSLNSISSTDAISQRRWDEKSGRSSACY